MTALHLALSAADTLGSLLELPRTVRSLAARVDRAIRSVDDMMIELAEAKEGRRVAEEAMDQRDRQWQLVLDSRVQAAEAKCAEWQERARERAKKAEAEVAFAVTEVERLVTQREESRQLAEKAASRVNELDIELRNVTASSGADKAERDEWRSRCLEAEVARDSLRKSAERAEAELFALRNEGEMFSTRGVIDPLRKPGESRAEAVRRLAAEREALRERAERAEAALASVKRARDTWQVDYTKVAEALGAVEHVSMGPVYPRPADECVARVEEMGRTVDALRAELEALKAPAAGDRVDVAKARGALQRLVDLAFNNPGDRPRFSIPVSQDDDDLILTRALEELAQAQRDREGDK